MPSIIRGNDGFDTGTEYGIGGDGYTWVDETANRAVGTTYTNTTGNAMSIAVRSYASAASSSLSILINGVETGLSGNGGTAAANYGTCYGIVPSGSTYEAVVSGSVSQILWSELKYTGGV